MSHTIQIKDPKRETYWFRCRKPVGAWASSSSSVSAQVSPPSERSSAAERRREAGSGKGGMTWVVVVCAGANIEGREGANVDAGRRRHKSNWMTGERNSEKNVNRLDTRLQTRMIRVS